MFEPRLELFLPPVLLLLGVIWQEMVARLAGLRPAYRDDANCGPTGKKATEHLTQATRWTERKEGRPQDFIGAFGMASSQVA